MTSEGSRVELKLSNDAWQVSAVAGAVEHFAHRAGFDEVGCKDLVAAAQEACRSTFRLLPPNDAILGVVVQGFPDRLEVTLELRAEGVPAAGFDTFTAVGAEGAAPGELAGLLLLSLVDRVQYRTEGGTSRLTLVKYLPARL